MEENNIHEGEGAEEIAQEVHEEPTVMRMMQVIIPSKFSGREGASFADWTKHFEQTSLLNQWPREDKLQFLAFSLEGTAKIAFEQLRPERKNSYEEAKDALMEVLGGLNKADLYEKIRERKQGAREPFDEYAYSVLDLCRKYDPNMPDSEVTTWILRAAHDYIRRSLISARFDDFFEFLKIAQRVEKMEKEISQERERTHNSAVNALELQMNEEEFIDEKIERKFQEWEARIDAKLDLITQVFSRSQERRVPQRWKSEDDQDFFDSSEKLSGKQGTAFRLRRGMM